MTPQGGRYGHVTSSGAWTPASLTSLVAWYDASNAGSITASGSPLKVSQWNDLSGAGRHLTQATGSNQPTTGTRTINSLNALLFTQSAIVNMTATIGTLTQPTTVLLVGMFDSGGSTQHILYDSNNAGARHQTWLVAASPYWSIYAGTVASVTGAVNVSTGVAYQTVTRYNTTTSNFYLNGTQYNGNMSAGSQQMTNLTVGADNAKTAAQSLNGLIAEFVVMNASISGSELTSWNTYCAKWGL